MWSSYVALSFTIALFIDVITISSASVCDNVGINNNLPKAYLSESGRVKNISLYWGSEPAYVASTLLAVILRHKIGYQHIKLVQGPHELATLARQVPYNTKQNYSEAIIAVAASWDAKPKMRGGTLGVSSGLAGPRLYEFGASSVPVRQQLYVRLADQYKSKRECSQVTQWSYYTDIAAIKQCGFTLSDDNKDNIVIYELPLYNNESTTTSKLKECTEVSLQFKTLNRTNIMQMVGSSNHSFLFVDYDIWAEYPNVNGVQSHLFSPVPNNGCSREMDTAVAMRVGDSFSLREFAPQLFEVVYNYFPEPNTIREILELYSERNNMEQAACEWVSKHNAAVTSWIGNYKPNQRDYEISIYYCKDDPDFSNYDALLTYIGMYTIRSLYRSEFSIRFRRYDVDCSNDFYVKDRIEYYMSIGTRQRFIGAIVSGVPNVTDVVKRIDGLGVPIMLFDAPEINADTTSSTWVTSGHSLHLAIAMHYFIHSMHWTRVGVLSEPTALAKRFMNELKAVDSSIGFGDHDVKLNLTLSEAESILQNLQKENARVILLNMNFKDASTILSAGVKLNMNSQKDYVWLLRERRSNQIISNNIRHFTISFSSVCGEEVSDTDGISTLRKRLSGMWKNCSSNRANSWPTLGTALIDAIFTLLHGFNSSIHKNPQIRNDVHSKEAIRLFEKSLIETPVQGVNQKLTYKGHSVEEVMVFINEWNGNRHKPIARWRVNATSRKVYEKFWWQPAFPNGIVPHDGRSRCLAKSGDLYLPTCYDAMWGTLLIFLVFIPPTAILAYRIGRRHLIEQQKKYICEVLTQRQQRAAALSASYLVDRSSLTLFQELGSGRFGVVRLGVLRVSCGAPKYVAVKALSDHQEESEILREACTLASLNHDNIIRLIGVCIDKDPPLVLMEVAFFGDLLQYLQDRRYLVHGVNSNLIGFEKTDEEANHVSAEALTRLARQAASALGYLTLRGVIHRDLRASNCLVDANRCLKLADFGLARETMATRLDGGAEYACRRRGLFPVLWMAPESLLHGVFSAASDMWGLGVLVFELVTLGARPFGDMAPLRVLQYVGMGGKPSMPRDATPQTIGLTRMCWQREPEQRPTAADVVAYLAERPCALRPALDCDYDKFADADSGYGESPMSELLPC